MDIYKKWLSLSDNEVHLLKDESSLIESISSEKIDQWAEAATEKAYHNIDCLSCANCCKSAPTTLHSYEIKRISRFLNISKKQFVRKYVFEDINGELTMNNVPCPFLNEDNTCSIYEVRPETCRKYPHSEQKGFKKILSYHKNNISYCPITYSVFTDLLTNIKKTKEI